MMFMRIKRSKKKGQIAPFLIAVIVILLIAIMVTVNLGKIGMSKTNTSNAADAGALAGASTIANGLNAIGDISNEMAADVISTEISLLFCPTCWIAWAIISSHWASQAALLVFAAVTGLKSSKEARKIAKQFAFMNAGIDETKPRNNMTYENWLKSKSNFEQWMDDENYDTNSNVVTYSWTDNQKYGQTPGGRTDSVKVDVQVRNLIPVPAPGFLWFWGKIIKPPECDGECCCGCYCGPVGTTWGIAYVTNANAPVTVKVTRFEPETNLGLWRMRYPNSLGVRSRAEAKAVDGFYWPFAASFKEWDSKLTDAE